MKDKKLGKYKAEAFYNAMMGDQTFIFEDKMHGSFADSNQFWKGFVDFMQKNSPKLNDIGSLFCLKVNSVFKKFASLDDRRSGIYTEQVDEDVQDLFIGTVCKIVNGKNLFEGLLMPSQNSGNFLRYKFLQWPKYLVLANLDGGNRPVLDLKEVRVPLSYTIEKNTYNEESATYDFLGMALGSNNHFVALVKDKNEKFYLYNDMKDSVPEVDLDKDFSFNAANNTISSFWQGGNFRGRLFFYRKRDVDQLTEKLEALRSYLETLKLRLQELSQGIQDLAVKLKE